MTEYLGLDDLLEIAVTAVGGDVGVRDHGLLASAAARPQTTVLGEDAYPDLHLKASALLHSLAGNHALVDGDKRLSWLATYTFLAINGVDVVTTDDDVVEFVLAVAAGKEPELEPIAAWLRARS